MLNFDQILQCSHLTRLNPSMMQVLEVQNNLPPKSSCAESCSQALLDLEYRDGCLVKIRMYVVFQVLSEKGGGKNPS